MKAFRRFACEALINFPHSFFLSSSFWITSIPPLGLSHDITFLLPHASATSSKSLLQRLQFVREAQVISHIGFSIETCTRWPLLPRSSSCLLLSLHRTLTTTSRIEVHEVTQDREVLLSRKLFFWKFHEIPEFDESHTPQALPDRFVTAPTATHSRLVFYLNSPERSHPETSAQLSPIHSVTQDARQTSQRLQCLLYTQVYSGQPAPSCQHGPRQARRPSRPHCRVPGHMAAH